MMTEFKKTLLLSISTALAVSACTFGRPRGPSQTITVQTRQNGAPFTGATCQLVNERGRWTIKRTPGSATIERGTGNLVAVCQNGQSAPGFLTIKTGMEPLPANASRGTSSPPVYASYPSTLTVDMGDNRSISAAP